MKSFIFALLNTRLCPGKRACGELEVLFVFIFVAGTAVEGEMEENSVFSASSSVYRS